MNKRIKKFFAALLVICFVLSILPQQTFAIDLGILERMDRDALTNPAYTDVLDLKRPSVAPVLRDFGTSVKASDICHTLDAAAQRLRQGMVSRQTAISVVFPADAEFDFDNIWRTSLEHTGTAVEGDYLKYQFSGYTWSVGYDSVGGIDCYNITFYPEYFTTAQQEAEMDAAVADLLEQLNLWDASDFEKIKGIYDWICSNVTYDYENLNNNKYFLKHSAYAALIHKTAVCQGYALLFYRLALELGVDARYISGSGKGGAHGWNIVKIGDLYYNLDATWDSSRVEVGLAYDYFLRGSSNFTDHTRDEEFNNPDFNIACPTSPTDYGMEMQWPVTGTCGDQASWSLDANGTLTISGTGAMDDYYAAYPQWNDYAWHIRNIVVEEGITSVGAYAFYFCTSLKQVTVKGSASIGEAAFIYCTKLESVSIPNVTSIGDLAFGGCTNLKGVDISASTTHIGIQAFAACSSLETITVSQENNVYCAVDNVLLTKDRTRLLAAAVSIGTSYVVPENVEQIDPYAFAYNPYLENIVIPGSVETISDYAFTMCTALQEITLPTSLRAIGECAFEGCAALMKVQLPEGLQVIGYNAFADCASLTEITIPSSVETIGECAFAGCDALIVVTFAGSVPNIGDYAFLEVFATVYYPDCDSTWGSELMTDYGGFLQWVSYDAHSFQTVITAPTCDQQGFTTYTCTGCGYSYKDNYVAATGHDWDEGTVTVPPTEVSAGERLHTCRVCSATKTESIPVQDHVHSFTDEVTAPTCEEQGYTTHRCACGESYIDTYVNATGHDLGQWEETQKPTCTEDGVRIKRCAHCDYSQTGVVAATGHNYSVVVTAPTCDGVGYTTHTCHCGHQYVDAYLDSLGHKFSAYVSDNNATCASDGTKTAVCDRGCGETDTVADIGSALAHTYTQSVTQPTCDAQGFTLYTCHCGHSYKDNYTDVLGHDFGDWYTVEQATENKDGLNRRDCSRCDHCEEEKVAYVAGPDSITSDRFAVGENTISKIAGNLTVGDFLAELHQKDYVRVLKDGQIVSADTLLGTGMEIQLVVNEQVIMSLTAIVTGDINGDGTISITDMLMIKSKLLKKSEIEGVYAVAADVNGDDTVSITDFIQVKSHILGKTTIEPLVSKV